MTAVENAAPAATEKCVQNQGKDDLITVHRDAIEMAAELIEESIRESFGWQYKSSSPIELARLLHTASSRPNTEYPGLGDLLTAHAALMLIAATPSLNDRSPEGIARLKLATLGYAKGGRVDGPVRRIFETGSY